MDDKSARNKRPRDRKSQLAAVASELFRARGYHGVGINDIAAEAGITGPALYRHFADKRSILGHVLLSGLDELEQATETALVTGDRPTPDHIHTLLEQLAVKSVERREVAALWRWEGRHLDPEAQRAIRNRSTAMLAMWTKTLMRMRPDLAADDAELLCWAGLSVFGSVSAHRTSIAKRRFAALLVDIALRVLHARLPPRETVEVGEVEAPPATLGTPSRREQLLTSAAELFRKHGFPSVSMEDIGKAAGIAGPSVYRHFPSKAALLAAIGRRAGDRLAIGAEYALHLSAPADERTALRGLAESYVRTLTGPPDLLVSFSVDRVHIDERDRPDLLRIQRDYVDQWVRLLTVVHPELDAKEARITVHAALTIANDLTRTRRVSARPGLTVELASVLNDVLDIA
ncbi:TetR family transcriptional regulator [Prauserella marina]|uniref:DNA-binding transcriptional regulator, AcrR family n=1 Tax=Prauserella marina TaxID=530584 RepID=A0A222VV87_9PSEU|nr:TetR/AcrR family transcriptional regulator [Prauserella marina]ASR37849.1 TetR family transcriptional regulator [Prauserella marina]PWV75816.1 TetR family transcriptional regulator [Prauserella marina]SDD25439.1 DNA-binding transcriptional regulator, AcrR family [Prauserella marina]